MSLQSLWPFHVPTGRSMFITKLPPVEYTSLTERARAEDINLMYVFNTEKPKNGGFTIAYRICSTFRNAKMVEVAVAYCAYGDTFEKKIGRELALNNFYAGRTIDVPARMNGDDDMHKYLRCMFCDFIPNNRV